MTSIEGVKEVVALGVRRETPRPTNNHSKSAIAPYVFLSGW